MYCFRKHFRRHSHLHVNVSSPNQFPFHTRNRSNGCLLHTTFSHGDQNSIRITLWWLAYQPPSFIEENLWESDGAVIPIRNVMPHCLFPVILVSARRCISCNLKTKLHSLKALSRAGRGMRWRLRVLVQGIKFSCHNLTQGSHGLRAES